MWESEKKTPTKLFRPEKSKLVWVCKEKSQQNFHLDKHAKVPFCLAAFLFKCWSVKKTFLEFFWLKQYFYVCSKFSYLLEYFCVPRDLWCLAYEIVWVLWGKFLFYFAVFSEFFSFNLLNFGWRYLSKLDFWKD